MTCESGGSLEAKPGAPTGFQSQSLKAVYYLKQAGFKKLRYMKVWWCQLRHNHCPCH